MTHYGTPRSIADRFDFSHAESQAIAYECSLCGLCTAVCLEKLDPAALFLEVRRLSCDAGNLDEAKYSSILGYEKKGTSKQFSWYGLPEGCDTIFFPGCTLPGTRPEVTTGLFRQIRQMIPTVGLVLDCCTKPSHDLGRSEHFKKMFEEMHGYLVRQGIRTVLTACPNCTKIFRQYGHGLRVKTVYEILHSPTSSGYLNRVVPRLHILDMLFSQVNSQGKAKVASAPFTYWHRLRLKRMMMRDDGFTVQRTRPVNK